MLFVPASVKLAGGGARGLSLTGTAGTINESFTNNPAAQGWQVFGDTNLFHWNSTNLNLAVTWDSSQTNSYFHIPLGTILDKDDDFSVICDVQFADITGGVNPAKPSSF